ncbi:MAG TPA: ATP-binding protein [Xanthobacteraceae bacterium]|nr:ATP-binding protein [Xanthobacteraceae bacterium]
MTSGQPSNETSNGSSAPRSGKAANADDNRLQGRSIGSAIRWLRLLLALSVVGPAAIFAFASWYDWRQTYDRSVLQASRTVQILREHALKVFEANEFAIDQVEERIAGMDWSEIRGSNDLHRYLARLVQRQRSVSSILLVAPDGKAANLSSRFPAPGIDMSDRAFFIAAKSGEVGTTRIGEPVVGRLIGVRIVVVSRPRFNADGTFNGVIAVAVLLDRFAEFYRDITSVAENSVTLGRTDGAVLAREPPITTGASKLSPASGFMRSIRTGGTVYRTVGELDGIERVHSIVPVGNYPVYVSYGVSLTAVRKQWLLDVLLFGGFATSAAIALFAVSLLALRRVRNEQRLTEQWQDEVQRRESAEGALRQTQKMEALGQLTGGVAHDFNNMLMVIGGNVEMLKRRAGPGLERQLAAIEHAVRSGEALTRKLLAFSRRRLVQVQAIELGPFAAKVVDLLKPSLPSGIELSVDIPADVWPVRADADDLELCLVNIVLNARDAMPDGGTVTISARNRTFDANRADTDPLEGDFVALAVRDNGTGIPGHLLSRVFEPFFTTKEVGRGTGLGLSQVYGFARQSGGTVAIDSEQGRGTTVTLMLRRSEPPAPQALHPTDDTVLPARVLLVEDNNDVAEAATAMLQSLGCKVKHAGAAEPALEMLAAGETVDLVLSDIVMPGGIDGVTLARTLRGRYPALPVLLTTGYSDAAQKAAAELFPILLKPYSMEALRLALVAAAAGRTDV